MDKEDKIRACYQHACLRYVSNDFMTNTTLRERFKIHQKNYSIASRIISDTIEAKLIKRDDPESTSKRDAKYIPYWV
jgi:ATP-dependent DNA helicase RecG